MSAVNARPADVLPLELVEEGVQLRMYGRYSLEPSRRSGSSVAGVKLQQHKTGAGRGCSPRWTGWDPGERQTLEYLVHAANAYPRLVEALRGALRALEHIDSDIVGDAEHSPVADRMILIARSGHAAHIRALLDLGEAL